ncbi:hypothetical protein Tsubulata_015701 [Turnera subulata]|uniref:Protein LURP-one-related 15 n=1 Tax=Turnera subulata TaxID=218843 RepID=A0A9Q0G3W2_9ROSI|nr:hypothetical protein Tsubulata_015701 [Turnera subulata]
MDKLGFMAAAAQQIMNPVPAMPAPPLENPVVVIGPQFLAQYPVDLAIKSRVFTLGENDFKVTDINGTLIFQVKSKLLSLHDTRYLQDAAGNTLANLKQRILTMHRRWEVFRGESPELLFTVKKSSLIQFKTELDVFVAANTAQKVPDFKIKGSWMERSCTITLGDSNIIIAQMHKKHNLTTVLFDNADSFAVTVYPNVDYAFIVALVVLLDEINDDRKGKD